MGLLVHERQDIERWALGRELSVADPAAGHPGRSGQDPCGTLEKVPVALIIGMGVRFIGSVFVTRLNREWHPMHSARRAGRRGPLVAGAAFAVPGGRAWTGGPFQLNIEAQRFLDRLGLSFFADE